MMVGRSAVDTWRWLVVRPLVGLVLGVLLVVPGITPARAQAGPTLISTPTFGRPNDVFYLAGGGFAPNQSLTVTMFCQDWWHSQYGHWSWTIPVNSKGAFAAYRAQVPTPLLVQQTPCVIYARKDENPLGVGIPFHIMAAAMSYPVEPLPIHLSFHTQLQPSGAMELVRAQSAPGATLIFSACCRTSRSWSYHTRLPWNGRKLLRWWFPGENKDERMLVTVQAQLGELTGETLTWFRFHTPPSALANRGNGA